MSRGLGGLPVFCWGDNDPVGRVEGWLASSERGQELLVASGGDDPAVRRVAGEEVALAGRQGVVLSFARDRFLAQPRYRPDEKLIESVLQSVAGIVAVGRTDDALLRVQVQDGVVYLRGSLPRVVDRRTLTERLGRIPGVLRVADELT
jgi:hypothetical protein